MRPRPNRQLASESTLYFSKRFCTLSFPYLWQAESFFCTACVIVYVLVTLTLPVQAQRVELSIDASKAGAKIDRNLFGQFAEHLGHGVYEGIWVGPDSAIPNTRG